MNDPVYGSNQIPGLPEHLITAMLRYEHGSGLFVAPYVEAVPRGYFVNSQNTVRTPPYATANLQMGYTYAPWKLSLYFEGRNLNNVNYVSAVIVDDANGKFFLPGDARAFYGGLAWSW